MSTPNPADRDAELSRREQELRQRELELRIRELETHIQNVSGNTLPADATPNGTPTELPITPTRPYKAKKTRWNLWKGKLWEGCQFFMIVVSVVLAIRIATWLGMILIVGMISWVAYKVFFEVDN